MTPEEIQALITKTLADALPGALTTALGPALKPITDGIAAQKAALEAIKGDSSEDKIAAAVKAALEAAAEENKTADDKTDDKLDPKVAAKLLELEGKLTAATTAVTTAEDARKAQALLTAFRGEVAKLVPADRVDDVIAVLHDQKGRVRYDDAGKMGLHFSRSGAAGDYEEILPFEKGLEEWAKGDGKRFLPASNVQGSGDGAGGAPRTNPSGELTEAGMREAVANGLRLVE